MGLLKDIHQHTKSSFLDCYRCACFFAFDRVSGNKAVDNQYGDVRSEEGKICTTIIRVFIPSKRSAVILSVRNEDYFQINRFTDLLQLMQR